MTAAWNIGSTTRPRSPGPAVWARWTWTTLAVTAPWLRTAPFGAPVVPLVYISLERIGSAHVHGRWRGASLGEPPFQRLPATGAGRSFGYGGVDALELRADLVDGGDSCRSTMRTDGCASVKSRPTRAASRQLISSSAGPAFAAASLSSRYQSAFWRGPPPCFLCRSSRPRAGLPTCSASRAASA